MGACVRVERNYFTGIGTAVMMADSPEPGSVELIDNYFGTSGYATSPSCELAVPYTYVSQLDETADIPMVVAGEPAGIQNNPHHPQQYSMRNYPNPLNPATVIEYSIPASSQVKIAVYTLTGEFVKTLYDGYRPAGTYRIFFDGTNLSSGVYLCRLLAGDVVITRKLVIIK
jgi:pectate lyase